MTRQYQMQNRIYFDNNATTKISQGALNGVIDAYNLYGNPSSIHTEGRSAAELLKKDRTVVAQCLGVSNIDHITFTSSGTESNNAAIRGCMCTRSPDSTILTSAVEHPSIGETIKLYQHAIAPVDGLGKIKLRPLEAALQKYGKSFGMVSIIHAQNEVGTIQPIYKISKLVREYCGDCVLMHTDATQTLGKYADISLSDFGVQLLTGSSHKFNGPRGVGILYMEPHCIHSSGYCTGGGQENGYRSGTENMAAIHGCAVALYEHTHDKRQAYETMMKIFDLKNYIVDTMELAYPDRVVVNGPREIEEALYNTVNISIPGISGLELVQALDRDGCAVSSGSACSKGKPSSTLRAMGLSEEVANSSLRISLGIESTLEECKIFLSLLDNVIKKRI